MATLSIPLNFASEMVGLSVALVLLLVAGLLLPPSERKRTRQGSGMLAGSILFGLVRQLFSFAHEGVVDRVLVFAATFCLLGSMGRSVVLLALDVVIERRTARTAPRIFRDLSTALIYLVVALMALRTVGVEPGSILTTSAVLTAVVGLAMQDTLGNLVSGLALQLQPPFDVGDWIEVDAGQQAGRVTEVTWRATTIMTLDHVEVILPNAHLAKAAIRNYSRPSTISRRRILVGISYASPPDEVHDALVAAARGVSGVLETPPPSSRTFALGESAVEYELFFFIDDFSVALRIDGAVRDRVYYMVARLGLEIPSPTRTLRIERRSSFDDAKQRDHARARCAAAISAAELAQPLPDDARQLLADRAVLRLYGPGEAIVSKGEPSLHFFIVDTGRVVVEVPRGPSVAPTALRAASLSPSSVPTASGAAGVATGVTGVAGAAGARVAEVAQLGPGQCFGEMGLLTGEMRSATVRAKTICRLVVVDHDAFHDVLASHPEVVEHLGVLLASRQSELDEAAMRPDEALPTEERSRRLMSQIRAFFKLA